MHSKCISSVLHSKSVVTPIGVLDLIACELGLHRVSRRPSSPSINNQSQSSSKSDKTTLVQLFDGKSSSSIINQTIDWLKWYFNDESRLSVANDDIGDGEQTRAPQLCTISYSKYLHVYLPNDN